MTFYLMGSLCPKHWQRLDPSLQLQSHRWKLGATCADLEWPARAGLGWRQPSPEALSEWPSGPFHPPGPFLACWLSI